MSMQKIVFISAIGSTYSGARNNKTVYGDKRWNDTTRYDNGSIHFHENVNFLLGGTMLSLLITIFCVICYCCNKTINKRSMALYRQRWIEQMNDPNMEIYSVEQFYDTASYPNNCLVPQSLPLPPQGLPPSYDAVMASEKEFLQDLKLSVTSKLLANQTKMCKHKMAQNALETQIKEDNENDMDSSASDCDTRRILCQIEREHVCNSSSQKSGYLSDSTDENGNQIESTVCFIVDETHEEPNERNSAICEECCLEECAANAIETMGPTASTSTECTAVATIESNTSIQHNKRNNENEFDNLNENGIVRMDMSKIIDATGLPTYDAALKLESCGYV